MTTCYKCGMEIPFGLECDPPCSGQDEKLTDAQIAESIQDYENKTTPIDWDKVKTIEDMKEIVRVLLIEDRIWKDSDEHEQLKRFLKDETK
jgi:hypothetical protein